MLRSSFLVYIYRHSIYSKRALSMHSSSLLDPAAALRKMKIFDLLVANIFLSMSQYSFFLPMTSNLLKQNMLGSLSRVICRATAFPLFSGGESLTQSASRAVQLNKSYKVKCILDHSIEEVEGEDSWSLNTLSKIKLIEKLVEINQSKRIVESIPVKCTSIMSSHLLERLTSLIQADPDCSDVDLVNSLSSADQLLYQKAIDNLQQLCQTASNAGINILLDAEQSYRQAGVELIYRQVAPRFNAQGSPVLFNTCQMYLKRSKLSVEKHLQHALDHKYAFAGKIVRGAYMVSERNRAQDMQYADPILSSKRAVDDSYNDIISKLINSISLSKSSSTCPYIIIATHNKSSIVQVVHFMKDLNLNNSTPHIKFAQILGISDHLSLALAQADYNVLKLICYGQYNQLLPWLIRRFHENSDVLGAMQVDKRLYQSELWKRITGF